MFWKTHTDKVHWTISMILARFRQINPFFATDARIKFCQAFVFPHLAYCSCIWGSTQLGRLFKLQKRAARMIYDLPTRTSTKPLLKKLGWVPLTDRVHYSKWCTNPSKVLHYNTWQKCISLFMMLEGGSHNIQTKLSCIWHLVHTSRFIMIVFSFPRLRSGTGCQLM